MQIKLHKNATTTLAIRQAIKESSLSAYALAKRYGISQTTAQRWKKNQKRGAVPEASKPREVVWMDTVDFGEVFAFSGIDIFTREADVILRPSLTSSDGLIFLKTAMSRRMEGQNLRMNSKPMCCNIPEDTE